MIEGSWSMSHLWWTPVNAKALTYFIIPLPVFCTCFSCTQVFKLRSKTFYIYNLPFVVGAGVVEVSIKSTEMLRISLKVHKNHKKSFKKSTEMPGISLKMWKKHKKSCKN